MAQLYQSRAPIPARLNANAPEFMPGPSSKGSAKEFGGANASGKGGRRSAPPQSPVPKNQNNYRSQQKSESRPRKQQQRKQEPRQPRYEEALFEDVAISAANNWGSPNKRGAISLNHLLNFSLPPRQRHTTGSSAPTRRRKDVVYEPYNKERFVNANFRFIMDEAGDYTVNLFDPDVIVEWKDIVQAIVPITKEASCPICLGPPIAPKVTKCGHVYCWPCILHYLHLGEKKWRKCPICYDAIYSKDLKSAQFFTAEEVGKATVGKPVKMEMVLMQRAMNSTVALPRLAYKTWSSNQTSPPSVANANAAPYAKLLLSTPEYRQTQILEREKRELRRMISEADNEEAAAKLMGVEARGGLGSERPFVEVALTEVKEAIEVIERANVVLRKAGKGKGGKKGSVVVGEEVQSVPKPTPESTTSWALDDAAKRYREENSTSNVFESAFSDAEGTPAKSDRTESQQQPVSEQKSLPAKTNAPPKDGMYYFYQSADGQHLYLHPLDIKVLKYEYDSYDHFPERVTVRSIHVQESTVNEDLRKRCKYLSHLPLSCDVNFCEIDLGELVSEATLKIFEKELTQRHRRYTAEERKEAQEKKRRSQESFAGGRSGTSPSFNFVPEQFDTEFPDELARSYGERSGGGWGEGQFDDAGSLGSDDGTGGGGGRGGGGGESVTSEGGSSWGETEAMMSRPRHATPPTTGNGPTPHLAKPLPATGSFARIAATSSSSSTPWTKRASSGRGGRGRSVYVDEDEEYMVDEYHGWTLDFEEAVMVDAGSAGGSGRNGGEGGKAGGKVKKGAKKVLLVTNQGRRGKY
ncbi:RING finger protein 10 [Rhizophlyctis rosea]|nr:RING finger protein 10 [Rhizophlyctis rosea]